MSALSPRQMFLLDLACGPIAEAFAATPYLVGTAGTRGDYRDVDVRLILDDKKHDRLRRAIGLDGIAGLGLFAGQYLASLTDLPIDFQIQRQAEANILHSGSRNPLGTRGLVNYRGDAQPKDARRILAVLREDAADV